MSDLIQLPTSKNFEFQFAELCRQARFRLRDLKQLIRYAVDDETRSAIENDYYTWQRLTERLEGLQSQYAELPR